MKLVKDAVLRKSIFLLSLALAIAAHAQAGNSGKPADDAARVPSTGALLNTASTIPPVIQFHGGPVMLDTKNVYLIWYGNWSGNTATSILPDFIRGLGGTPYFKINSTYTDNAGRPIQNTLTLAGQTFDSLYSQGSQLTDTALFNVVNQSLFNGSLPTDVNGIYFVLSSADVGQNGVVGTFCSTICGFHTRATMNGIDIKYAFVGNAARCPSACEASNLGVGPNGNAGADAMASVMAHELNETVTDPDLNAWYDANRAENSDKCNFSFGPEFPAANGAPADVAIGNRLFLIQMNWMNLGTGECTMGPGIALSASPTAVTATRPFSASTTISLFGPPNQVLGLMTLSVSGLPAGVTAAFSVNPTSTSSVLTLTAASGTVPGTYSLVVTGTGGYLVNQIPLTLTVR